MLVFTILLFVIEPFLVYGLLHRRADAGDESVFMLLHAIQWVLLVLSLVTAFAAVLDIHGVTFGG